MYVTLCCLWINLTLFCLAFLLFDKIKFRLFVFLFFKCLFCIKFSIFTNKSVLEGEKGCCYILFSVADACCLW